MRFLFALILIVLTLAPALAEATRPADPLLDRLARADESEGQVLASEILDLWSQSGSATGDLLQTRALMMLAGEENALALALCDQLVSLFPAHAQGWYVRALAHLALDEPVRAVADLEHVLMLEPRHFAALYALGRVLEGLDKPTAALTIYERLGEVYPFSEGVGPRDLLRESLAGTPI